VCVATPLHDVEALVSLAEGPPTPTQAWAVSRLAIVAPERFHFFPTTDDTLDEVFAAGPPLLVPALVEALGTQDPCPTSLAASSASLGTFGGLPEDRSALVAALRGALREDGSEADLWLAHALASNGEADTRVLLAANRVEGPDRTWLMPSIVLSAAAPTGALSEAAREVADALLGAQDPRVLYAVLAALGVPTGPDVSATADVRSAAALGAAAANAEPPHLKSRKGSRNRRIQGAVRDLLEGVEGPAAALLRALYEERADPRWGLMPVAVAAWLAAFRETDPIDDVLHHLGGADPNRLSRARASITSAHQPAILKALSTGADPTAGVIAMPLVNQGDAELAEAVVNVLLGSARTDVRADVLASAAAWYCADRIPELLGDRATRDLGLLMAEWTPTEEVLRALMELPVPADRDPRIQYAQSLAAMGDAAAIPLLTALLGADESEDLVGARVLAESILQRPI